MTHSQRRAEFCHANPDTAKGSCVGAPAVASLSLLSTSPNGGVFLFLQTGKDAGEPLPSERGGGGRVPTLTAVDQGERPRTARSARFVAISGISRRASADGGSGGANTGEQSKRAARRENSCCSSSYCAGAEPPQRRRGGNRERQRSVQGAKRRYRTRRRAGHS